AELGDDANRVTVIGFAETATGLGHLVAEALDAQLYLHSTRRSVPGVVRAGVFAEEHSHATEHLLLPAEPAMLTAAGPLVLVDDELSTGRTVANTLRALHALCPRQHYVVAALVDVRSAEDGAVLAALGVELGARVAVVSLAVGTVSVPADVLERGAALVAELDGPPSRSALHAPVHRVELGWPQGLPDGGRHGVTRAHRATLEAALPAMAQRISAALGPDSARVLVLGFEELMHAPLRLATALADARADVTVRSSTTTRSPVLALEHPGYAVRHRLDFPAHDHPVHIPSQTRPEDGAGTRHAYNITPRAYDAVLLVVDTPADTPELDGLLAALASVTERVLLAVVPSYVPDPRALRGPEFGSYAPDEVGWLLTDLSDVALEAPVEEREEAVQGGGAHYAESLPIEYQPEPAYLELFHAALAESARRLAHAVGMVTEILIAERGPDVVLASLARAGTPIGVLVRRWASHTRGLELPHYAVSIVRGRGIDPVALAYLADRYDPGSVVFLDGWTGKGAIAGELTAALDAHHAATGQRFDDSLAVLADPGHCVRTFGTRADYLIPSACLNSTVSGLVSRTVLNTWDLAPGQLHGAKCYRDLADADVSSVFLDAVSAHFDDVAEEVATDWPVLAASEREPTWQGWRAVTAISESYGMGSENLVKPGVGETTRVLLRRVPWKVLVRPDALGELAHVLLLARQRGVPVEEVDDLAYSCVGLIHPRYTRGATGADGTAAG
ncbi:MAG: phosphoribosyltransferase, partial [Mycobacteriaceae bacterium]